MQGPGPSKEGQGQGVERVIPVCLRVSRLQQDFHAQRAATGAHASTLRHLALPMRFLRQGLRRKAEPADPRVDPQE